LADEENHHFAPILPEIRGKSGMPQKNARKVRKTRGDGLNAILTRIFFGHPRFDDVFPAAKNPGFGEPDASSS
jgi:hypothetical protein